MKKEYFVLLGILSLLVLAGCKPGAVTDGTAGDASYSPAAEGDAQIVEIGLTREGYSPQVITVEKGRKVILKNDGTLQGCALYPVQPELGINANFAQSDEFSFVPEKEGTFPYSCSMGMWKGTIMVV